MVLLTSGIVRVTNEFVVNFLKANVRDPLEMETLIGKWNDAKTEKAMRECIDGKCFSKNPPRIVSKYLYFCNDERRTIFDEIAKGILPPMNIRDLTKELGKRWQIFLSQTNGLDDKSCYSSSDSNIVDRVRLINESYAKDKARYYRQKREYVETDLSKRQLKRVKRSRKD